MKTLPKIILIGLILVISVGCDQATKSVAREHLAAAPPISYWGDVFRFHYIENVGAFLGMGSMLSESARFWLLVVVNGVVLLGMLLFIVAARDLKPLNVLGWSLIIGGGVGNLVDRLLYEGAVIDFMNMGLGRLRTGIFNVADVAIVLGLVIVVAASLWDGRSSQSDGEQDKAGLEL
jgi:signal peptidase II